MSHIEKPEQNIQTPEQFAAFWDDHHFKDGCQWKKEEDIPKSYFEAIIKFPRAMKEMYSYFGRGRKYFDDMRAFLAVKPSIPIKKLRSGDEFKTSDYPRGTIIKIEKEESLPASKFNIYQYKMWGFIQQELNPDNLWEDIIIAFPEHHFNLGGNPPFGYIAHRNWHNQFIVNEVIHERDKVGPSGLESLRRYHEVEIWKFGQGVRERVPEKVPSGALRTKRV